MSRQELIAKIRYENELPAPLLPPKLIKYQASPDEDVSSSKLLTSLYTKTNVTPLIDLDHDLGMPLDLLTIPGVLNQQNVGGLFGYDNIKLKQEDRVLLRDPGMDKVVQSDLSKVTFLRRTEYVISTNMSKADKVKRTRSALQNEETLTPEQVLEKVESTFNHRTDDLEKLRHPIKKKVKAVNSWNLLPDTVSMDQGYFTVKFVGSAALDGKEKEKYDMSTALLRPVELEEDEWISAYSTEKESSTKLSENLEQQIDEISHDDSIYKFKRFRDFDMKQIEPETQSSDLALRYDNDKRTVYYKPLRSRLELRRRRVNDVIRPLVREHNWDQINVRLRAPTTKETKVRDAIRMRYDPIDFPALDDDEEEEEAEDNEDRDSQNGEDSQNQGLASTENVKPTASDEVKEESVQSATNELASQKDEDIKPESPV
ncbi:Paf1p [Kluyveromyces lactis]|uniref:KLLA0F01925p n=1 Tax=Kluyveromyces lactis (strain ATCC 8585 / CBS 2359 / DSM 70799 / NBRC 1267 / NRRL Y-1140 / WM37) TaxID=284590 RepID=Q6CLM2_KLULA|nr:uncharacterized protein KLLA0_F01925g [Kluyveromyces lactis]CAG97874.1 KLLA0F01925p [Kluyveromyces lactis]|eukprot:XP_455167.1 uncharacterized protein KLLA0_F01925g [Kluyveromyces lactis]